MKKALLFTILVCTSSAVLAHHSYQELRTIYKQALYVNQRALMADQRQYFAFIEPYLQELEETSTVVSYCKEHDGNDQLFTNYFNCLFNYNVVVFQHYIKPTSLAIDMQVTRIQNDLLSAMCAIKKAHIPDLDVQEEINIITRLLERANKAYYQKLGIVKKLLLFWA